MYLGIHVYEANMPLWQGEAEWKAAEAPALRALMGAAGVGASHLGG